MGVLEAVPACTGKGCAGKKTVTLHSINILKFKQERHRLTEMENLHFTETWWISDQCIVTCLSGKIDWFVCLDECHWSIDSDHDFSDFFRVKCAALHLYFEALHLIILHWRSLWQKYRQVNHSLTNNRIFCKSVTEFIFIHSYWSFKNYR